MGTALAKVWLAVKYIVATGVLLLAALMGLGWYTNNSKEEALKNSPFIQQLERTERDKGDLLKLLFDGIGRTDENEARLAIDWLKPREQRGELPYLYLIGLYHGKQTDRHHQSEGIGYFAKAALVYRVDAYRCGDSTANQAVPIMEGFLKMQVLRDGLKLEKNADVRKKAVEGALAYEQKTTDRPLPKWICVHGIRPGSPPPSEADWQQKRQAIRTSFEKSF